MPEYLHPSVNSRIIDNSFVFQTSSGSTVLFACGKATKGPDNKLTRLTSVSEAQFIFGEPNLTETGQTLYNVFNWLQAGGEVYFIRVLPDDAKFANIMLSVTTDTTGAVKQVVPKLASTATSASIASIETVLGAAPVTASGITTYNLAVFYPQGRGAAYDGLGVRITLMDSLDNTYAFRTYALEITAKDATGADAVVEGPFTVAFEPTAKDRNRESMYFANVVNKYAKMMKVLARDDLYNEIRTYIAYGDSVDLGTSAANPLHFDIFTGKERVGETNPIHTIVKFAIPGGIPTSNQVVNATASVVSAVNHITGGTDGTWTGGNSEESLLVQAYKGVTDPACLDKKQYLFDVLLDGNNSSAVKNAMSEMADAIRGDCVALLDCGFQANYVQTVDYRTNSISMSSFKTGIYAQDLMVFDEYTGSNIKVTLPYFLAKKIPANDDQNGIQWSFSGPRRGVLSGFDAINFFPNEMEKETLYKKQINYIEKDPKRINIATQLTSQTVNSALSNLNNVRALMRIKRAVEQMMDEYRDEFNDATTHESMSYNLNNYLQTWTSNRTCKSISGSVYASDYDRQQKIARVKVEMVFTGLIERIYIDFIVNR